MSALATTKQTNFINKLVSERAYAEVIDFDNLSVRDASNLIDKLLGMPKVNVAPAPARVIVQELDLGVYKLDNTIYRVKRSRNLGKLYAERLGANMKFAYVQGAIRNLRPEHKMSLADAKAFGVETGFCCVCGAFLTDERSVREGIGPVCASRF